MTKSKKHIKQSDAIIKKNLQQKWNIYNFLPLLNFGNNYCYAIENVWISLLMIAYGTTYNMDRFIWLIPLFLVLFLRPFVINFIKSSKLCKIYLKTKIIAYFYCIAPFGIGLIAYSTFIENKYFYSKIIYCAIGWTTMDTCLGLASYIAQQLKIVMENDQQMVQKIKKQHQSTHQHKESNFQILLHKLSGIKLKYFKKSLNYSVLGEITGYLFSVLICLFGKSDSFEAFYRLCNIAYTSCLFAQLFMGISLFYKLSDYQESKQKTINTNLNTKSFLKSVTLLVKTSLKERVFLIIHFIEFFIVDLFLIFTTYWIAAVYPKQFQLGKTYTYGVFIGSIYLIVFTLISNMKIPRIKHFSVLNTINFLKKYVVFLMIISGLSFYFFQQKLIFIFVLTGATLLSIYRNKLYPHFMREDLFRECVQSVQKFQKIFRLTLFPLFVKFVFRMKLLTDNSIWTTLFFLNIVLVIVFIFFLDTKKHRHFFQSQSERQRNEQKQNKNQKQKHLQSSKQNKRLKQNKRSKQNNKTK